MVGDWSGFCTEVDDSWTGYACADETPTLQHAHERTNHAAASAFLLASIAADDSDPTTAGAMDHPTTELDSSTWCWAMNMSNDETTPTDATELPTDATSPVPDNPSDPKGCGNTQF